MPTKIVAADGSGDYTNMEQLRAALLAAPAITEPYIIQIKGVVTAATTSMVYPSGLTATNYVKYEGVTTDAKITNSGAGAVAALSTGVAHLRIGNLTLESVNTFLALQTTGAGASYTFHLDKVTIKQPDATASPNLTLSSGSSEVIFKNLVFIGNTRGVDFRSATTGTVKVLNCTFWLKSGDYPCLLANNTQVYNSYAGNAGTSTKDWLLSSGKLTNGSNNASKDTSATTITNVAGAGGVGASAFTDAATYDFSLATSSPLIDIGTTVAEVTDDIIGTARPKGAAYDIGAYEKDSGGGTPPTGTVTIGTITKTATTATIPYTYSAADQTGFEYRLNGGATVADAASPVDLTGLTASTAYTIEVRAVNASGAGAWSAVANFTTDAAPAVPPTGTVTLGTITTGNTTASVPYTYSASDQTGFQYRVNGGTPTTATASPQQLTGLPSATAGTVEIRAVNANGNGAWSAVGNFTTKTPASFSGTVPMLSGNNGTAITPVNLSTYFAGTSAPFAYSVFSGTLPTGLTLNTSTGVISGTPTVTSTGNVVVRATDASGAIADTNSFSVAIAAAPGVGTITINNIAQNNNVKWSSAAVDAATVMPIGVGSVVVSKTGLTTTAGASPSVTFSDAAIVAGTEYIIILKIGTAYGWYRTTAT